MTALKINIPEVSAEIVLSCSAIFAAAMTKDKVEVNKNAEAIVVLVSNQRFINKTGISFDTTKAMMSTGIIKSRDGSLIKDGILRSTPTIIKNIGIKNPYPNESNFSTISSSGFNNETTTPARNAPKIYSAPTPSASATNKIINAKLHESQFELCHP